MKSFQNFIRQLFYIFSLGLVGISFIGLLLYGLNLHKEKQKILDEVGSKVGMQITMGVRNARNNLLVAESLLQDQVQKKTFDEIFIGKILSSAIFYNTAQYSIYLALSKDAAQKIRGNFSGLKFSASRNEKNLFFEEEEDFKKLKSSYVFKNFSLSTFKDDIYLKKTDEKWYHESIRNNGRLTYIDFFFDENYSKKNLISLAKSVYDTSKNLIGVVGVDYEIILLQKVFTSFSTGLGIVTFQNDDGKVVIHVPSRNFSVMPEVANTQTYISEFFKDHQQLIKEAGLGLIHREINNRVIVYKVYKAAMLPWHLVVYQEATRFYRPIVYFCLINAVLLILLLTGFIFFLRKSEDEFLPPLNTFLNSLLHNVDIVSHHKNITGKYDESNISEINDIVKAVNKLFDILNENFHNYKKEFDKNIKSKEELLREAEKSIHLRDDFLSIASHELKTPLTPIRMQLSLIRRSLKDLKETNPKADLLLKNLDDTDRQFDRFLKLVDNLLDVSRISADRLIIDREKMNLSDLVMQKITDYKVKFAMANYDVLSDITPDIIGFWDKVRIDQVLTNLLDNAIKYGNGKPLEIILQLVKKENIVRLIIRDHGIGIGKEDIPKLFGRFERIAPVSKYGGLGLGLYIANRIVIAHGGIIKVESVINSGSSFIVELPLLQN